MSWTEWAASADKDTAHQIVLARRFMARWGFDQRADSCVQSELLMAAIAHLVVPGGEDLWPFADVPYPSQLDHVERIVNAGAYLAAEGDRLLRARAEGRTAASGLILLSPSAEDITQCVDGLRTIKREMGALRDEHGDGD